MTPDGPRDLVDWLGRELLRMAAGSPTMAGADGRLAIIRLQIAKSIDEPQPDAATEVAEGAVAGAGRPHAGEERLIGALSQAGADGWELVSAHAVSLDWAK